MNARPSMSRRASGFTLVELLASMSVLTLLMLVVVQMINSAAAVTSGTTRHLDADSQARLAFDRMAVDFAQIVKRGDVDYYLQKNTGDDQMAFYSETSGYYPSGVTGPVPKSNTALVGYRINTNRQLERLNKALIWNGVTSSTAGASGMSNGTRSMTFLPQTLTATWPNIAANGTDPDYQVIGESVFRMEICYLVRNATTAAKLSETPYVPPATPTPTPTPGTTPASLNNGLRDVANVVVTLAVLDNTSRLIVQPADLAAAAAKLLDSSVTLANTPPTTPAKAWQTLADNGGLIGGAGAGLSKRAAANVHIYERYFAIGNAQ